VNFSHDPRCSGFVRFILFPLRFFRLDLRQPLFQLHVDLLLRQIRIDPQTLQAPIF
jgi:hypothetical protein